jgi:Nuclease A inhibitor-like protein
MNMIRLLLNLTLLAATAGCTGATLDAASSTSESALNLAPADAARVLDFVNYPGTDEALLDNGVMLDTRAAHNIIGARPFATLAALDAVPYVGDTALTRLANYSAAHPAPAGETVETVVFAGWESQAVVWGVNQAAAGELDGLLDSRAASGLMARRPFSTVTAMGPVPYVGATALQALRAHAPAWWTAMGGAPPPSTGTPSLAGTFDGVSFDEATAKTALDIANQASYAQLTANGVPGTGAAPIAGNRPYSTLAQVSAVSGVGPATMTALRAYAQSGNWGGAVSCVASFDNAVGPHLPDLLFLSESDRPLDLVSFSARGSSTLTADLFFTILQKPAGWSYESRDPNHFYEGLEPSSSTADAGAAAAVQAAFGPLTNVLYVAVHKPASDPYHAEVDVYLVGLTPCGDIVGIHSIAVET